MTLRRLALTAVGLAVFGSLFTAGMSALSSAGSPFRPPEDVPRSLILAAILATPGVIGFFGLASSRPVLMAVGGVLYLILAPLAFSGVLLVFLLPAVLFLRCNRDCLPGSLARAEGR